MKQGIKSKWTAVLAVALLLCCAAALSVILSLPKDAYAVGAVELPKTGQTTTYATGDDGDLEIGVAWPVPRFKVGTGAEADCVTDNLTGLMWVKNPDSTPLTWEDALTYANKLTLCGHDDWRLPNVNELESLIHAGQSNTATWLNAQGFSNVQSDWYWSSTTSAFSTEDAWFVFMQNGNVRIDGKGVHNYVWPVRAGSGGSFYNLAILKSGTGTGTVTSNPAGINCGGTCSANFAENTNVTLTATPAAGSTFTGWSGGTGSASGCTGTDDCTFNITADSRVTATFTLKQYSITTSADPVAGGSVSCNPNPVNHGSTSNCTITTNTGYTLHNVTGTCGGNLVGNTYTTNPITSNCTVEATFTLNQYTVTPSAGAGGTIAPNTPQTVNHGSTTQFTVTPNPGYTASVGGTCGGTLVGNTYTTNPITSNCTVEATFTLIPDPDPQPNPDPQPTTEVIRNSSPWIIYFGGWQSSSAPCGTTIMKTENITGNFSYAELTFEGAHISWRAMVSPRGGTARVYIDGVYVGKANLYRTFTDCNVEVFSYALTAGTHTIKIVPEPLLPGRSINIDSFVITR